MPSSLLSPLVLITFKQVLAGEFKLVIGGWLLRFSGSLPLVLAMLTVTAGGSVIGGDSEEVPCSSSTSFVLGGLTLATRVVITGERLLGLSGSLSFVLGMVTVTVGVVIGGDLELPCSSTFVLGVLTIVAGGVVIGGRLLGVVGSSPFVLDMMTVTAGVVIGGDLELPCSPTFVLGVLTLAAGGVVTGGRLLGLLGSPPFVLTETTAGAVDGGDMEGSRCSFSLISGMLTVETGGVDER